MNVEQWLGENNVLGQDIWNKKYRHNNESFDEWLDRVSGGNKELKKLIKEKKFLFGGRALTNRGTINKGSMFNCYSSGYCPDDLNGILQLNTNIGLTYKAQGGQGISLTKVRPIDTPVGKEYKSDGIVPFMELFNATTSSISQGGARKGALMMSIDIKHKEAPTFITIKTNEDKITKANLSLEIDDEFMEAVQEYYTKNKVIALHQKEIYNGHIVEYDIVPIELYKLMINTVYDWGEPGCIFTERFRNYNLMEKDDEYQIVTCNPCTSGDTEILTKEGYLRIDSIVGQEVEIWNGYEWSKVIPEITGHNQDMKLITFSNGEQLKCTDYHKFILKDNSRIEAKKLSVGDSLIKCNFPIISGGNSIDEKLAYTQGFFCGDGSVNKDDTKHIIYLYGEKINLKDYLMASTVRDDGNRLALSVQPYKQYFDKSFVPNTEYDIKARLDWLAGYIDSDGTVQSQKSGGISISSINKENLIKVKRLLNTLGCDGKVSVMHEETEKLMPTNNDNNKEKYKLYKCKESYRLLISKSSLSELIKLGLNTHRVHADCNTNRSAERFITVTNIEDSGFCENVYCFTEPKNHSGIFNGVITAQCGEQPMPKNFSCNLGSLNLYEFIINPFKPNSKFDEYGFKKAVHIAIEALDTIIDENKDKHALAEQRENSLNYRNIGLGIFGYADALMALGLKFGDKQAQSMTKHIFELLFKESVISSNKLAEKKGVFPKYTDKVWESEIIKKHFTQGEINELKPYGLRNCSLVSIAPTGSIATMMGMSGGCEPEFALSYKRRTENLKDSYQVNCKAVEDYLKVNNLPSDSKLPDYFVTSAQIKWSDRIDTQAIMQESVDTAISSTLNLERAIPLEVVEQIYLYAWSKGLKGVTIFRSGCKREGILTTNNKDSNVESDIAKNTLPRGYIIEADDCAIGKKRKLTTGCGSLHCTAFFDPINGDLLETYLSKGSSGGCNNFMIGLSRMISLASRGGVNIESIIDQLNSCGTCPSYAVRSAKKHDTSKGSCCPIAIGNALKEMYNETQDELGLKDFNDNEKDNYKIKEIQHKEIKEIKHKKNDNPKCPECGEPIIFEGGCNLCHSCGWSKCE